MHDHILCGKTRPSWTPLEVIITANRLYCCLWMRITRGLKPAVSRTLGSHFSWAGRDPNHVKLKIISSSLYFISRDQVNKKFKSWLPSPETYLDLPPQRWTEWQQTLISPEPALSSPSVVPEVCQLKTSWTDISRQFSYAHINHGNKRRLLC